METDEELLAHELKDIFFAEQEQVKMLKTLAKESTRKDIKSAYKIHLAETKNHVKRIKNSFRMLGMKPKPETCYAIIGLAREYKHFKSEKPTKVILDKYNLGAAMKAEHYEISSYENIIKIAADLGFDDVSRELEMNLQEERMALANLQAMA
ncbi:MAG TPA: DUF892 family protein [Acidobacteriota bacterium]|nr:DUF892 family protein [Acidobacteriota bacterium]